ncbi:MAG: PRC-barrel domain-containing protein, partial [Ignavibacteriales bacterium]
LILAVLAPLAAQADPLAPRGDQQPWLDSGTMPPAARREAAPSAPAAATLAGLVGKPVTASGRRLGQVTEVSTARDGTVSAVVVTLEGNGRLVALPWQWFAGQTGAAELGLPASAAQLRWLGLTN